MNRVYRSEMPLVHHLRSGLELVFTFCWDLFLPFLALQHAYYGVRRTLSVFSETSLSKPLLEPSDALDTSTVTTSKPPPTVVGSIPINLSIVHGISTPHIKQTICDFLDAHAAAYPAALAIQDILGSQLTYRGLQTRSLCLAQQLKTLGVHRGSRVCLVLERSLEHIVALFAVLRLGAAYIPLDGTLVPQSVLQGIVKNAQPAVILVSRAHVARTGSADGKWYCIEDLLEAKAQMRPVTTFNDARPQDPAYIIFTSGNDQCFGIVCTVT